jgi:hypothetical protein
MIMMRMKSDITFNTKINLYPELKAIADTIVIPRLAEGIDAGKNIDGGNLPKNEPETILRKGHSRPLIGLTGKLRSSFKSIKRGARSVAVILNDARADIGSYLQDGIKTLKGVKKYEFFGITKVMETEALHFMEQRIDELINGTGK